MGGWLVIVEKWWGIVSAKYGVSNTPTPPPLPPLSAVARRPPCSPDLPAGRLTIRGPRRPRLWGSEWQWVAVSQWEPGQDCSRLTPSTWSTPSHHHPHTAAAYWQNSPLSRPEVTRPLDCKALLRTPRYWPTTKLWRSNKSQESNKCSSHSPSQPRCVRNTEQYSAVPSTQSDQRWGGNTTEVELEGRVKCTTLITQFHTDKSGNISKYFSD